jgi:phage protein U
MVEVVRLPGLGDPARGRGGPLLMFWGPCQFQVFPLNYEELEHETETEWAPKEIAGAALYREWVGENDETITLRGKIFPYTRIGGLYEIEYLEAMRRAGHCDLIGRADGYIHGWFVCERLSREHTAIFRTGVGQQVEFEATFKRAPVPNQDGQFPRLFRLTKG